MSCAAPKGSVNETKFPAETNIFGEMSEVRTFRCSLSSRNSLYYISFMKLIIGKRGL